MKRRTKSQGFSILEMLFAMSITIGLTGTLFYFFKQSQDTFVVESARTEMNQNFRAAMDLMARDIQAAGAGIPLFLGPLAGKDGGGANANPSLNPPDTLLVLYGNSSVTPVSVKATSTYPAPTGTSSTIYTDIPTTAFATGNYLLYTVAQSQMRATNLTDYAEFSLFTLANSSAIQAELSQTRATLANFTTLQADLSQAQQAVVPVFCRGLLERGNPEIARGRCRSCAGYVR